MKIEIGRKTQAIIALLLMIGVAGAIAEYGNNINIPGKYSGTKGVSNFLIRSGTPGDYTEELQIYTSTNLIDTKGNSVVNTGLIRIENDVAPAAGGAESRVQITREADTAIGGSVIGKKMTLVAPGFHFLRYDGASFFEIYNNQTMRLPNNVGIKTTNTTSALQVGDSGDGTMAWANSWNVYSSEKYKENISNATFGNYALQPIQYNQKQDTSGIKYYGFIAEDMPEGIKVSDGNKTGINIMGIIAYQQNIINKQQIILNNICSNNATLCIDAGGK